MKTPMTLLPVVLFVAVAAYAPRVAAETCTVSGTIKSESIDNYYCDTTIAGQSCTSWIVKDLDVGTKALRAMSIAIRATNGAVYGSGATDGNGFYSISFSRPSCAGTAIQVQAIFMRMIGTTHGMFRITSGESDGDTFSVLAASTTLSGPTKTGVDSSFTSGMPRQWGSVYVTAEQTIQEMRGWSTNLADQFKSPSSAVDGTGMLRIIHGPQVTGSTPFFSHQWFVWLPWDFGHQGAHLRHELGHAAHHAIHARALFSASSCSSYNLLSSSGHQTDSCEYGYPATTEGMATFFGIRSIFSGETSGNVWWCFCADSTDQEVCSKTAAAGTNSRGLANCSVGGGLGFVGIGDNFSNDPATCLDLNGSLGCGCGVAGTCSRAWSQSNGWRNENQIVRFLWDMIDAHQELGDTTNLTTGGLVSALQGMSTAPGVNGSCNEPNVSPCVPADGLAGSPVHFATRNSYNAFDLDVAFPGNQELDRSLNCVQGATN